MVVHRWISFVLMATSFMMQFDVCTALRLGMLPSVTGRSSPGWTASFVCSRGLRGLSLQRAQPQSPRFVPRNFEHCRMQMQDLSPDGIREIVADLDVTSNPLRTFGLLGAWVAFPAYALAFAVPNESPDSTIQFFVECLKFPGGDVNPLFQALFFLFGLYNVFFAAILLPLKPKDQKLPVWPFLAPTWALGMGSMTPYLALKRYDPSAEKIADPGFWGGRAVGVISLLAAVGFTMYGVGLFAPNNINGGSDYSLDVLFYSYLKDYPALFASNRFVNLTTVDSACLWVLLLQPLLEDMRWRGWFKGEVADWALFASFMVLPFIGPSVWLAVRPPPPASDGGGSADAGQSEA